MNIYLNLSNYLGKKHSILIQIMRRLTLGQSEGFCPDEIRARAQKALALVSDKELRISFGNLTKTLRKDGDKVTKAKISELVDQKLSKTISGSFT